jgi:hypothetical protein
MDGDSADRLTWEDATPAGVIDEAVAAKEDAAALQSLLERTTALPRPVSPDRTNKIFCRFIQTAHYLGEFLRHRPILFPITDVAKSPHHDFAR